MKKLRGYLISEEGAKPIEIEDEPEALRQAIGAETFDILERHIMGLPFDFVIDDEGRLRGRGQGAVSFDMAEGQPVMDEDIRGALLILKGPQYTDDEDEHSLTEGDIDLIRGMIAPRERLYTEQGIRNLRPLPGVLIYEARTRERQKAIDDIKRFFEANGETITEINGDGKEE